MSKVEIPILTPPLVARPRCARCQARSAIQRVVPARPGFEHWTLRCTSCGHLQEAQVQTDPMKSAALGWLDSHLNPPKQEALHAKPGKDGVVFSGS